MIASGRSQTRTNANRMYITPMVPYHQTQIDPAGGGKYVAVVGYESSATLEPLDEHLTELEWSLSQQYGIGIYHNLRGYRAYQSEASKAVMLKWIQWFKRYRTILTTDFQTLQCATSCNWKVATDAGLEDDDKEEDNAGVAVPLSKRASINFQRKIRRRDPASSHQLPFERVEGNDPTPNATCSVTSWDGVVHWASLENFPTLTERALAVVWNPLPTSIKAASIRIPLYYSGLSKVNGVEEVAVQEQGGEAANIKLGDGDVVEVDANLKPMSVTWFVVTAVASQ